ncbi:MAG: carboxypeptidase-like regulatory domain-containing protein [Candidatus Binatia bacterium]
MTQRTKWFIAAMLAVWGIGAPSASPATTVTPSPTATASPSPQRTGDLGTKRVVGRVFDASRGSAVGISGATVSIAHRGAGSVSTDATGDFAISVFLHDTDTVVVQAAAYGFSPAEVRFTGVQLWFLQTPVEIGLAPLHTVRGVVHGDVNCPTESRIVVELAEQDSGDLARAAETTAEVEFAFPGVADGDYTITATPDCQPSSYQPVDVYVRGADAYTELDPDPCPSTLVIDPVRGLPGTTVEVIGRCYYIHSGGRAQLLLDGGNVATVVAGTVGDYRAQIDIPADFADGLHTIIATNLAGDQIGAGGYYVDTSSTRECIGDCDRNGAVTISELLDVVNLSLGQRPRFGCNAATADGTQPVRITTIIAAVQAAVHGCRASLGGACYENSDCTASAEPYEPYLTGRGECCRLWRTGSLPFTWCPGEAFDAESGACSQCASPC